MKIEVSEDQNTVIVDDAAFEYRIADALMAARDA